MSAKAKRTMALGALACWACLDVGPDTSSETVEITHARLLDVLCERNAYTLDGAATRIAGPTEDSCAFDLGPGTGSVSFPSDAVPEFERFAEGYGVIDVLMVDLGERNPRPRWLTLDTPAPEGTANRVGYEPPTIPLTITSEGKHLALLDIEVKVVTSYSGGCSLPRRSRRPPRAPILHTRLSWTPTAS